MANWSARELSVTVTELLCFVGLVTARSRTAAKLLITPASQRNMRMARHDDGVGDGDGFYYTPINARPKRRAALIRSFCVLRAVAGAINPLR